MLECFFWGDLVATEVYSKRCSVVHKHAELGIARLLKPLLCHLRIAWYHDPRLLGFCTFVLCRCVRGGVWNLTKHSEVFILNAFSVRKNPQQIQKISCYAHIDVPKQHASRDVGLDPVDASKDRLFTVT